MCHSGGDYGRLVRSVRGAYKWRHHHFPRFGGFQVPAPTAENSVGRGVVIGLGFEFERASFGMLTVQKRHAQSAALGFTSAPIPLSAAFWMYLAAIDGLGLFGSHLDG